MSYDITDAVTKNRRYPNFRIRDREDVECLEVGDSAQLLLHNDAYEYAPGEFLWFKITNIKITGLVPFVGVLEDDPGNIVALEKGSTIEFGHRHTIDIRTT